jgi:transposase
MSVQGAHVPPNYDLPRVKKRKRLTPREQEIFTNRVVKAYQKGASIRDIMAETGRSYGFIHRIIDQSSEVQMRSRGGTNHHPVSRKTPQQ